MLEKTQCVVQLTGTAPHTTFLPSDSTVLIDFISVEKATRSRSTPNGRIEHYNGFGCFPAKKLRNIKNSSLTCNHPFQCIHTWKTWFFQVNKFSHTLLQWANFSGFRCIFGCHASLLYSSFLFSHESSKAVFYCHWLRRHFVCGTVMMMLLNLHFHGKLGKYHTDRQSFFTIHD